MTLVIRSHRFTKWSQILQIGSLITWDFTKFTPVTMISQKVYKVKTVLCNVISRSFWQISSNLKSLHKNRSFSSRTSLVNATKSAGIFMFCAVSNFARKKFYLRHIETITKYCIPIINIFMTEVPIINKTIHWFALQINGLVSLWQGSPL